MGETQILDINLWKVFIQGSFAPKTPNLDRVKQAPHSEQARGQRMHCREILFTPRCRPRARKFVRSIVNFLYDVQLRSYGALNLPKCSDFGLFSPYKTPKTYLPVTSLQHRGYIAEWFRFFLVIVSRVILPVLDHIGPDSTIQGILFTTKHVIYQVKVSFRDLLVCWHFPVLTWVGQGSPVMWFSKLPFQSSVQAGSL